MTICVRALFESNLIKNQNLVVHIGQNILDCLDDDSRKSCRLVNSSMKNMVDNPKYWIHKLLKKGIDQEHLKSWRTLTSLVENTDLKDNLTICLMKMFQKISEWFQALIHVASKAGDAALVQIILKHDDDSVRPNQFGNTLMGLAASRGHLEVMKVLINSTKDPNVAGNDGWTPIHSAADKGYIEIVKLLMSTTDNPNAQSNDGSTPLLFCHEWPSGSCDVIDVFK